MNAAGRENSQTLELFVAESGVLSARIRRSDGYRHIHSSVKPEDEAAYFSGLSFWGDLVVFLGTGLGWHLRGAIAGLPPGNRVLLAEYYPQLLSRCRENLFAGLTNELHAVSPAMPDWRETVAEASLDARTIQIVRHPASYQANPAFYDAVLDALKFKRIRRKEPPSALLFYGNFFCEEEIRGTLARGQARPSLFRYDEPQSGVAYESALARAIQEGRPDYILSVNMKGFDGNGIVGSLSARFGVPVVVWFVDDPHPILLAQKAFVKNHFVALSWERAYLPWLGRQGFGACGYLPLAADPILFDAAGPRGPAAEIGFVGSSMGHRFLGDIAAKFLWNSTLEPLVQGAARLLLEHRTTPVRQLLEQACREQKQSIPFSDDRNLTWLLSYIIHTASMLRRKELVTACLPFGIHCFGDPEGWRELTGGKAACHPDIDYRTGLASVYRSLDITVNSTSCQMATAVNQRVFDVPLCGGFLLNDDQADLAELFEHDEVALYRSEKDLLEQISFFKSHADVRARIAAKARSRVLSSHTYSHRLEQLRKLVF